MKFSFFILTYNRPSETQEAVDNVANFVEVPEGDEREIIIVNNNSSVDYTSFEKYIDNITDLTYYKNKINSGVAGGRNIATELCTGDVLISLDDDAEYLEANMLFKLKELMAKYHDDDIGIYTFKVVERSDGRVHMATKNKSDLNKKEFFTTYFKGGAHAILRPVSSQLNGYKIGGVYGAEEYDLSYRALDEGFKILHTSQISILHKKSPTGREGYAKQLGYLLQNKSLIAYKYLPTKYFLSHLVLWSGHYLIKTKGDIIGMMRFINSTISLTKKTNKTPVSDDCIDYVKSIGGRLHY